MIVRDSLSQPKFGKLLLVDETAPDQKLALWNGRGASRSSDVNPPV